MDEFFNKWQKPLGEIVGVTELNGESHLVMTKGVSGLAYTPLKYHFKRFGEALVRHEQNRIIDIIFQSDTLLDIEKVELTEKIQGKNL